jgi:hypothetical protein
VTGTRIVTIFIIPNGPCFPPRPPDLDGQAARGPGHRLQVRAVRGGDGVHDGQPQAQPARRTAGGIHPLEGPEQPAELVRRDDRAGIGHRQERPARPAAGRDLHLAARRVVPDRVVHQVGDQSLGQRGVARRGRRPQPGGHGELGGLRIVRAAGQHVAGQDRQVERLEGVQAAFAPGQREQGRDEVFLLLFGGQGPLAGGAQRGLGGLPVPQRDLEQGPLPGQRRAQLVRRVRHELALSPERGVQPAEQLVEGVTELLELIVGTGHPDALMQAAGRDPAGGGRDRAQRAEHPPGHQPAQADRHHGHDAERDPGLDQQPVQRAAGRPHRHGLQQGLAGARLDRPGKGAGHRGAARRAAGAAGRHLPVAADEDRPGAGRDLWQLLLDQEVRDGQQAGSRGQEQAHIQQRQPHSYRVSGSLCFPRSPPGPL